MTVRCDSFDIRLVRVVRSDGADGDLIPCCTLYLHGSPVGSYLSYHVADRLRRWARVLGPLPWSKPVGFDIRLIRLEKGRGVYSLLPEPIQ